MRLYLKIMRFMARIVSLDQLGSRRAIAVFFVMFIPGVSQKASNIHKPLSQSWPLSTNLKHSKYT